MVFGSQLHIIMDYFNKCNELQNIQNYPLYNTILAGFHTSSVWSGDKIAVHYTVALPVYLSAHKYYMKSNTVILKTLFNQL